MQNGSEYWEYLLPSSVPGHSTERPYALSDLGSRSPVKLLRPRGTKTLGAKFLCMALTPIDFNGELKTYTPLWI